MNILTLIPRRSRLNYAFFPDDRPTALWAGRLERDPSARDERTDWEKELKRLNGLCREQAPEEPLEVALRMPYGGERFSGPTILDDGVLLSLKELISEAPLHLPGLIGWAEVCQSIFSPNPIILSFETAFFTHLPEGERGYGLPRETGNGKNPRRFGFHGLFHQNAWRQAYEHGRRNGRTFRRVLSVCLEPHPEMAAILDGQPAAVTGGATPLEGLPGETICGDLDPGIVLFLAEELKWGPERINAALMRDGGLSGMIGRTVCLTDLTAPTDPELRFVREFFFHRLLLACGAGIAALGGVDALIFSGRRGAVGEMLGPRLAERIRILPGKPDVVWFSCKESLERLVANEALNFPIAVEPTV